VVLKGLLRSEKPFIIQAQVPSSFCGHLTTIVSTKKTDYLVEVSMTKSQKKLSVAQKLRKRALEKI